MIAKSTISLYHPECIHHDMLMKMSLTRLCISTALLAIFTYKCLATGGACNHQCIRDGTCNSKLVHDKCYYLFKDTQRKWNDSKHHCIKQNLSIGQIRKGFDGLFLGLDTESFAWQGGIIKDLDQLEYVNGRPFNRTIQQEARKCAVMKGKHNEVHFNEEFCTDKYRYICRLGQYNLTTSQEKQSWFDARSACLNQGGNLFYLNSGETLTDDTLTEQLNEIRSSGEKFYIGVRNFKWVWPDGTEIRNFDWSVGQPGSSKDCVAFSPTNAWFTHPCTSSSSIYALCQNEIVCINLPPPNNGKVYTESEHYIKGKTMIGHKAIFTCDEGFILKGSATLTCIGDGPENRFDGQQPTCESTPWILFTICLLIVVGLVTYIVISKIQKNTRNRMEMHDNTDTSLRAVTYVPAAGMAGNTGNTGNTGITGGSQAMRSGTGHNAVENMEIVDNEYYNSSEASGGTTAHGNAENPGFKIGPKTGDIYAEVQKK